MQLADCLPRQAVDVGRRIEPHVVRAEDDVADVAQELAAGAMRELAEKITFSHARPRESHVARRILEEIRTSERVLHLTDMVGHEAQRLDVVWQREEIV